MLFNTPEGRGFLAHRKGVPAEIVAALEHFGLSSICNVLAAIKTVEAARPRTRRRGHHRGDRRRRAVPERAGQDARSAGSADRSARWTRPRSSPSTSARPAPTTCSTARSRTGPASSTSATTRGSSSRARRSTCSRPGARRRSGGGCAATSAVWDELIDDFNARVADEPVTQRRRLPLRGLRDRGRHRHPVAVALPEGHREDRHHVLQIVRRPGPLQTVDDPNPFVAFGAELAWQAFARRPRHDRRRRGRARAPGGRAGDGGGRRGLRGHAVRPGRRAVRAARVHRRGRRVGEGRDRRTGGEPQGQAPALDPAPPARRPSCSAWAVARAAWPSRRAGTPRWPRRRWPRPTGASSRSSSRRGPHPSVVDALHRLRAEVTICPRRDDDPPGDPCVHRCAGGRRRGRGPVRGAGSGERALRSTAAARSGGR